jgi:hypothetical protein
VGLLLFLNRKTEKPIGGEYYSYNRADERWLGGALLPPSHLPLLGGLLYSHRRCVSGPSVSPVFPLVFPLLTHLRSYGCTGLTGAGLAGLQSPRLISLQVEDCPGTTVTGLAGLLQYPLLTGLGLSGCSGITSASLAALQCPLLASLELSGCSSTAVPDFIQDSQVELCHARVVAVRTRF